MSEVFLLFAGLSIFIACLGLFGLAAFMAAMRTKGNRHTKSAGATMTGLVITIQRLLKLVILSLVIASPLAYYFMEKWLQDFAYRIDIQWTVFALAGCGSRGSFFDGGISECKSSIGEPGGVTEE